MENENENENGQIGEIANDVEKDYELPCGGLLHNKRLGREMAMQYLFQCDLTASEFDAESWRLFCEQAANDHGFSENRYARKCRTYAEKLLSAVFSDRERIDRTIHDFVRNWAPERLSAVDRNVLRVALAEMFNFNDVPPVVSIDEAVAITRDYSGEAAGDFINGILNSVKDTLNRPAREACK